MWFDLLLIVVVLLLLAKGVRVVPEHQRLAIVRLGRYAGLRGPGLVFTLPGVDKATRFDLDRDVPGWRSLSTERLSEEISQRLSM